jgi:hypothetical protein
MAPAAPSAPSAAVPSGTADRDNGPIPRQATGSGAQTRYGIDA